MGDSTDLKEENSVPTPTEETPSGSKDLSKLVSVAFSFTLV